MIEVEYIKFFSFGTSGSSKRKVAQKELFASGQGASELEKPSWLWVNHSFNRCNGVTAKVARIDSKI